MNPFFDKLDEKNIRRFRMTFLGYVTLKEQTSNILEFINKLLQEKKLSYNEIIVQSYDFLEEKIPDFFNFFCNLYYLGTCFDNRKMLLNNQDLEQCKRFIRTNKLNYYNYFYNNETTPIIYIISRSNNKKPFPFGLIALKTLLSFIININGYNYEDLQTAKHSFIEDVLEFKRGLLFDY